MNEKKKMTQREFFGSTRAVVKADMITRLDKADPVRQRRNELRDKFREMPIYERAVLTLLVKGDDNHEQFIRKTAGVNSALLETIDFMSTLDLDMFRYSFDKLQLNFKQAEQIVLEKAEHYNHGFDNMKKDEYAVIGALAVADENQREEILSSPNLTLRHIELWDRFQKFPAWLVKQIKENESPIWGDGAIKYLYAKGILEKTPERNKKWEQDSAYGKMMSSIYPAYNRGIVHQAERGANLDRLYQQAENGEYNYLLDQERKDEMEWQHIQSYEGIPEEERTTLYRH